MRRAAQLYSRFKTFEPLVIPRLGFLSNLAERIVPPDQWLPLHGVQIDLYTSSTQQYYFCTVVPEVSTRTTVQNSMVDTAVAVLLPFSVFSGYSVFSTSEVLEIPLCSSSVLSVSRNFSNPKMSSDVCVTWSIQVSGLPLPPLSLVDTVRLHKTEYSRTSIIVW